MTSVRPKNKNKPNFYANGSRSVKAHISHAETGLPLHTVEISYLPSDFHDFLNEYHQDVVTTAPETKQTKQQKAHMARLRRQFETGLAVKALVEQEKERSDKNPFTYVLSLDNANLDGVVLDGIDAPFPVSMREASFVGGVFKDSYVKELDMQGMDARNSQLKDVYAYDVNARNADLRGAETNCLFTKHSKWCGAKMGDGTRVKGDLNLTFYAASFAGNVKTALEKRLKPKRTKGLSL